MATGLEALGAASAVLSVISFGGKIISISYKIYNGMPTDEDQLEDYANRMLDAADRVKLRTEGMSQCTPTEARLSEISQKCIDIAGALQKETQNIIKRRQKRNVFKATFTAVRASVHRPRIEELERSLNMCKQVMETELLLEICDRGTAIKQQQSQAFQHLESDVQSLISHIAKGQTHIEMLITQEAKMTRDALSTSFVAQLDASDTKAITDSQRQRLLKSLKPEEIRQRYNDVMSPSDARFQRVFASHERVCSKDPEHKDWNKIQTAFPVSTYREVTDSEIDEIDIVWNSFSSWLQSNDNIFWIQGKPGSGKTTLMRYVIENDNTKHLLSCWGQNTRVLSYFLWKIGAESQNSIKGLLCCLTYDILNDDTQMTDEVLKEFSFSTSKDFYKEWSSEEAETVLFWLLHTQNRPTCFFIDALDEASDTIGFSPLMSVIERLRSMPKVKVCVSSRPETALVNKLDAMGAKSLRLEALTRPEMVVYIHDNLKQSSNRRISDYTFKRLVDKLLYKADGVFLWLVLATNSLASGIDNGDDEQTLFSRLNELPSELEHLYEAMWSRLNGDSRIYKRTAAKYFRYILADGWYTEVAVKWDGFRHMGWHPTLAQLSLMVKVDENGIFPPKADDEALSKLDVLCEETANDIRIRCAGMLQIRETSVFEAIHTYETNFPPRIDPFIRHVGFIHRTAHDFLVDTEAGQKIINYDFDVTASINFQLKLFKSWLYLTSLYNTLGVAGISEVLVANLAQLQDSGVDQSIISGLLPVIQNLDNEGAFQSSDVDTPISSLPVQLACQFPALGEFLVPWLMQPNSPQAATFALRDICLECEATRGQGPPTQIIRKLMALGGDPHVIERPEVVETVGLSIIRRSSAFEVLLRGALEHFVADKQMVLPALMEIIDIMAPTCPDWERRIIIAQPLSAYPDYVSVDPTDLDSRGLSRPWVACEVDMQFLLTGLLAAVASCRMPNQCYRLREITQSFTKPYLRIRHIAARQGIGRDVLCYRILIQEPFQGLLGHFFDPKCTTNMTIDKALDLIENSLTSSPDPQLDSISGSFEKVSFNTEVDCLAQEDIGVLSTADFNHFYL